MCQFRPTPPSRTATFVVPLEGQALLLAAGRRMAAQSADDLWRDTPQWRRLAEAVSQALPGRGWRPTRAEAEAFMRRFAATNERARRRFLPHLPTLFPLDFSDLPEAPVLATPDSVIGAALDVLTHQMAASTGRDAQTALHKFGLLKRLEDRPAMRQALLRAIKFAPDLLPARLRAVDFYLEDGDLARAAEHFEAARRLAPEDASVQRVAGRLQRAQRAPADCVRRPGDLPLDHAGAVAPERPYSTQAEVTNLRDGFPRKARTSFLKTRSKRLFLIWFGAARRHSGQK